MKKHKKINLTVWIGLLLIIIAFSIWLYSIIEIKSNEIMLATQDLPVEKVWLYEGALQWWKNAYWAAILPVWGILTISGIGTILSPQLRGFTQKLALRKPRLTVFEEEAVSNKDNKKEEKMVVLQNLVTNKDNAKEEPILVLQSLIREEANLKEEKNKLASFREELQLKIEEDIERKKNNIQKLRAEINDLTSICEELTKSPRLAQE